MESVAATMSNMSLGLPGRNHQANGVNANLSDLIGQQHPVNARNLNVQSVMAESSNNPIIQEVLEQQHNQAQVGFQAQKNVNLRKTF